MVHHGCYGSLVVLWANRSCKQNEKYGYMFYAFYFFHEHYDFMCYVSRV